MQECSVCPPEVAFYCTLCKQCQCEDCDCPCMYKTDFYIYPPPEPCIGGLCYVYGACICGSEEGLSGPSQFNGLCIIRTALSPLVNTYAHVLLPTAVDARRGSSTGR